MYIKLPAKDQHSANGAQKNIKSVGYNQEATIKQETITNSLCHRNQASDCHHIRRCLSKVFESELRDAKFSGYTTGQLHQRYSEHFVLCCRKTRTQGLDKRKLIDHLFQIL